MSPSLPSAIRTAIHHGAQWEKINPFAWAYTYATSVEEINRLWKAELTKETNARESGGEGK